MSDTTVRGSNAPKDSSSSSYDAENNSEGLTRANKIAIGVGVGIVLPSCLASVMNLLIRIRELRQELREARNAASEDVELEPALSIEKPESVIYRSERSKWSLSL